MCAYMCVSVGGEGAYMYVQVHTRVLVHIQGHHLGRLRGQFSPQDCVCPLKVWLAPPMGHNTELFFLLYRTYIVPVIT